MCVCVNVRERESPIRCVRHESSRLDFTSTTRKSFFLWGGVLLVISILVWHVSLYNTAALLLYHFNSFFYLTFLVVGRSTVKRPSLLALFGLPSLAPYWLGGQDRYSVTHTPTCDTSNKRSGQPK